MVHVHILFFLSLSIEKQVNGLLKTVYYVCDKNIVIPNVKIKSSLQKCIYFYLENMCIDFFQHSFKYILCGGLMQLNIKMKFHCCGTYLVADVDYEENQFHKIFSLKILLIWIQVFMISDLLVFVSSKFSRTEVTHTKKSR